MAENGTLQKLLDIRKGYFASVQAVLDGINAQISSLQAKYLDALVDATLGDPTITEIQRVLKTKLILGQPTAVAVSPVVGEEKVYESTINEGLTTEGKATEAAVPIAQSGDPDKFPLKTRRTRLPQPFRPSGSTCPNCGSQIRERNARFCSKCAAPLVGLRLR